VLVATVMRILAIVRVAMMPMNSVKVPLRQGTIQVTTVGVRS